jgi:hypothetical protein
VGPGYLKNLETSFNKSSLRVKTPMPVFAKAKIPSFFHQKAQSTKFVPGVGEYKDSDRAYKNNIIIHKERVPYISKYKFTRFTESASKSKSWVPGPGSYDVVPYSKKEKKA